MKRIATIALVAVLGIGLAVPAFAETSTTSAQTLIDALKAQIQALSSQLETLRSAQQQVQQTQGQIGDTLKLIRELKKGMSGDDVKVLQALLAADPTIFPEGRITGFFGPLTERAVKNYQKKHGIEQAGRVGPKTLKKFNEDLDEHMVSLENSTTSEGRRPCAIVPPGHLIAPGWLKKQGGERPIVPLCQILPPGIAKKLGFGFGTTTPGHGTTTPDTIAPIISELTASTTSALTARITWTTNEFATSRVWYSSSTPVVTTATGTLMINSGALVKNHEIFLTGLTGTTTYYYLVSSSDIFGNTATSGQPSFTTPGL